MLRRSLCPAHLQGRPFAGERRGWPTARLSLHTQRPEAAERDPDGHAGAAAGVSGRGAGGLAASPCVVGCACRWILLRVGREPYLEGLQPADVISARHLQFEVGVID